MQDPRLYQIAVLSSLLGYGMVWLDFDIAIPRVALLLGSVLATQALGDWLTARRLGLCRSIVNYRSALISGLSLCLLLRTNYPELAVLAAVLTIAGKFLVRCRGKHLFNPTNGGLVAMLLLTNQVWVSPGQWGAAPALGVLFACVGMVVVNRASRSDVTLAFLVFFCALMFGRSIYLGEPMAIPIHRLESGVLLLFAFFMISDPMTVPNRGSARMAYAVVVAVAAFLWHFELFKPNGLVWALFFCAPLVPIIDRFFPAPRFEWRGQQTGGGRA